MVSRLRSVLRLTSLPACALVVAASAGCERIIPAPGSVLVAVTSNLAPGQDFNVMRMEVLDEANATSADGLPPLFEDRGVGGSASEVLLPLTFVVTGDPQGRDEDSPQTALVRLTMIRGNARAVVVRDIRMPMPQQREEKMLHVSLDWLSMTTSPREPGEVQSVDGFPFPATQDCDIDQTRITDGTCTNAAVADGQLDRQLTAVDLPSVFGGGDALDSPDARCFDAPSCFTNKVVASLDEAGCTVALPEGFTTAANLNVALDTAGSDPEIQTQISALEAQQVDPPKAELQARIGVARLNLSVLRCVGVDAKGSFLVDPDGKVPAGGCGDELGERRGVVLDSEVYSVSGNTLKLPKRVCDRLKGTANNVLLSASCPAKVRSVPLCAAGGVSGRINSDQRIRSGS